MENMARSVSPESVAACWGSDMDNRNIIEDSWHPLNGHGEHMFVPDPTTLQQQPAGLEFQHFHLSSAPTSHPAHTEDQIGDQYRNHTRFYSASTYPYPYADSSYTNNVQYAAASSANLVGNGDDISSTYSSGAANHQTEAPPLTNGINGGRLGKKALGEDGSEPRTFPASGNETFVSDHRGHEDTAYGQPAFDPTYTYSLTSNEQNTEGSEHSQRRRRLHRTIAHVDQELGERRRRSQQDS
ncbi:hypothetical protein F4810DRAFT_668258 [Camillea tinctor]|nr:hypothetical protein F4810DRAFT_668258 [Camillea tinctor]